MTIFAWKVPRARVETFDLFFPHTKSKVPRARVETFDLFFHTQKLSRTTHDLLLFHNANK